MVPCRAISAALRSSPRRGRSPPATNDPAPDGSPTPRDHGSSPTRTAWSSAGHLAVIGGVVRASPHPPWRRRPLPGMCRNQIARTSHVPDFDLAYGGRPHEDQPPATDTLTRQPTRRRHASETDRFNANRQHSRRFSRILSPAQLTDLVRDELVRRQSSQLTCPNPQDLPAPANAGVRVDSNAGSDIRPQRSADGRPSPQGRTRSFVAGQPPHRGR